MVGDKISLPMKKMPFLSPINDQENLKKMVESCQSLGSKQSHGSHYNWWTKIKDPKRAFLNLCTTTTQVQASIITFENSHEY